MTKELSLQRKAARQVKAAARSYVDAGRIDHELEHIAAARRSVYHHAADLCINPMLINGLPTESDIFGKGRK